MLCSHQVHRATVCQLQSEVAALKAEVAELRSVLRATPSNTTASDTIAALASEVQQLKVAVADAPTLCLQEQNPANSLPWNEVVRRKRKPKSAQPPRLPASQRGSNQRRQGDAPKSADNGDQGKERAPKRDSHPVPGKRRIWGTMKQCTASAVERAIAQLAQVPDNSIKAKRKYKKLDKGKLRWWHVIAGEETVLKQLENEWENVERQTAWVEG